MGVLEDTPTKRYHIVPGNCHRKIHIHLELQYRYVCLCNIKALLIHLPEVLDQFFSKSFSPERSPFHPYFVDLSTRRLPIGWFFSSAFLIHSWQMFLWPSFILKCMAKSCIDFICQQCLQGFSLTSMTKNLF